MTMTATQCYFLIWAATYFDLIRSTQWYFIFLDSILTAFAITPIFVIVVARNGLDIMKPYHVPMC